MEEKITKELLEQSIEEHDNFIRMVCKNKYGHDNIEDVIEGVISYCNITDEGQKELLRSGKFIPAGSILSACNSGNPNSSFSNCYLTKIESDSMDGIFECQKNLANTFKYRGGSGFDITILRPKNTIVNNAAKTSSGSVSFLPSFSEVGRVVGTNGRRAASLCSQDLRHPDSLDFIWCKADPKRVFEKDVFNNTFPDISSINVSVKIPDSFFKALKYDQDWVFCFPDFENQKELYDEVWDGDYDKWFKNGGQFKEYGKIKAKNLLSQISEAAWICGDPGIIYIDTVQKNTFGSYIDDSLIPQSSNPCFSEDTLIPTTKGIFPIKSLIGKEVTVFDGENWVKCDNFRQTGVGETLIELTFSDGSTIKVTPYHNMYLKSGEKLKVSDLSIGDRLLYNIENTYHGNLNEKSAYFKGFCCGDGTVNKDGKA